MVSGDFTMGSSGILNSLKGRFWGLLHTSKQAIDYWGGPNYKTLQMTHSLPAPKLTAPTIPSQIYLHIPGSEKLALELPLVVGNIPFSGVGSRTSSMSSQAESLGSWLSFRSAPPSYSSFQRELRLDGPSTPLLHDYDGAEEEGEGESDGGLFMRAPHLNYTPPPAYSQVRQLKHLTSCVSITPRIAQNQTIKTWWKKQLNFSKNDC